MNAWNSHLANFELLPLPSVWIVEQHELKRVYIYYLHGDTFKFKRFALCMN